MALSKIDSSSVNGLGYGFKNRIINGDMRIDQRNAGASVAVTGNTGAMSVDRFELTVYGSGTGRFSAQQSTNAPAGFINSLLLTVTTADASPSSSYAYGVGQTFEGLNVSDLGWGASGAKPVAVSFWAKSSLTGTFPVVLNSADLTLAYGATYTISSANTWEYKTVYVTGPTSGGTTSFPVTTSASFNVKWGLGGGSGRTIASGSWVSTPGSTQLNVTGCTQLIATSGATLQITGVQLEKGAVATEFDYRPYGAELALCQRYYYVSPSGAAYIGVNYNGSRSYTGGIPYPVTMRAAPTITQTVAACYEGGSSRTVTQGGTDGISTGWFNIYYDIAGGTIGRAQQTAVNWSASAEL